MSTFEIVIITGALCGLLMVVGGLILLATGAIKLSEAAKEGFFTVEYKKELRVTTSYPSIAFFLIGLAFIIAAAVIVKPQKDDSIQITGHVDALDPTAVRITVAQDRQQTWTPDSTGNMRLDYSPYIKEFKVVVSAAGSDPPKREYNLTLDGAKSRTLPLPEKVSFRPVVPKSAAGKIIDVPNGISLTPIENGGAF